MCYTQVLDYMTSQMAFNQVAHNLTHSVEPRMNEVFTVLKKVMVLGCLGCRSMRGEHEKWSFVPGVSKTFPQS